VNGAPGASERLSSWDFFYALDMALACLISYAVSTYALSPFLNRPDAFLAGMWTTVATVFVFHTRQRGKSSTAWISRAAALRKLLLVMVARSCEFSFPAWPNLRAPRRKVESSEKGERGC